MKGHTVFALLFLPLIFLSCLPKEYVANSYDAALPVQININCSKFSASDCSVLAVSKHLYFRWISGHCSERGTDVKVKAKSLDLTVDVFGASVKYTDDIIYENNDAYIENGDYALWVYIDSNSDETLDRSEPIVCQDIRVEGDITALEIIKGWRDAEANDAIIFND